MIVLHRRRVRILQQSLLEPE